MGLNDFFENERRKGNTGRSTFNEEVKNVGKKVKTDIMSATSWQNSVIDQEWAEGYKSPSAYYDYFFAGQDIKVTIDGVEDDYPDIPIVNFAFNVGQQKTPVYGLWSYTYDGVMRGTRLVSGTFTIATKSTGYMRDLLTKAARTRHDIANGVKTPGRQLYSDRQLTEDDANIYKYWTKNIDPNLSAAGKNIFSSHPPFSFVILYGVQNTSVTADGWSDAVTNNIDNVMNQDLNERLVLPTKDNGGTYFYSNRYVLEACELQGLQTGFAPDGAVIAETYQFFARDIITSVLPN